MEGIKESKTSLYSRYRWRIFILIVVLISAVILTIIFVVIQTKHKSESSIINISNITIINEKHNVNDEENSLENLDKCFIRL